jgi:hypothetical protein
VANWTGQLWRLIGGVITAADLTNRFGEIAKPFNQIEECERRLRRRVKAQISAEIIATATNGCSPCCSPSIRCPSEARRTVRRAGGR